MELAGQLIIGPGLFILGLFFAMLPFVTVRIFGVVLLSFAAISGALTPEGLVLTLYPAIFSLAVLAVAGGAYVNYLLTGRRVKRFIEQSKSGAQAGKVFVPYCKDGTWFHPGLAYADGLYRVGPRGGEQCAESYQHALEMLRDMPVACWRRPSPVSGLLGMVSATHWGEPPLHDERQRVVSATPPEG